MANNRMWLVHDASGQRVHLASHFGGPWKLWTGGLEERLTAAWTNQSSGEHEDTTPWGSVGWHLEFEQVSELDDPLVPNTVEP